MILGSKRWSVVALFNDVVGLLWVLDKRMTEVLFVSPPPPPKKSRYKEGVLKRGTTVHILLCFRALFK